jgi:hypothetical protein
VVAIGIGKEPRSGEIIDARDKQKGGNGPMGGDWKGTSNEIDSRWRHRAKHSESRIPTRGGITIDRNDVDSNALGSIDSSE